MQLSVLEKLEYCRTGSKVGKRKNLFNTKDKDLTKLLSELLCSAVCGEKIPIVKLVQDLTGKQFATILEEGFKKFNPTVDWFCEKYL